MHFACFLALENEFSCERGEHLVQIQIDFAAIDGKCDKFPVSLGGDKTNVEPCVSNNWFILIMLYYARHETWVQPNAQIIDFLQRRTFFAFCSINYPKP